MFDALSYDGSVMSLNLGEFTLLSFVKEGYLFVLHAVLHKACGLM